MTAIPMDPTGTMPLAAPRPAEFSPSPAQVVATPPPVPSMAVPAASGRLDALTNVLLIEELPEVAQRIADLLGEHEGIRLAETVADGRMALDRIRATGPDVIMIDVLMQGAENGLQIAKKVRASGVTTPILLMTIPKMPVVLNDEMGIADVQDLPLEREALTSSITRMDEQHRGPAPVMPSGMFVVFSGKGGVGRTTMAHRLAAAMAKRPGARVALVDGDLVHGDLRLHLDAPDDAPSIIQLPTGDVHPDELRELMWKDPAGLDVLLAPPLLEQADLIVQRDLENTLAVLQKAYDAVVIDAPTTLDDKTLAMLDRADVVIDVVTPERDVLRKARRYHRAFDVAGLPMSKFVSVLNRAHASGASAAELSAELGRQLEALVPDHASIGADTGADAAVSPAFDHLASLVIAKSTGTATDSEAAA